MGVDPERDHDQMRTDMHPVDEHRQQIELGHVAAEQLGKLRLGCACEAAGDRRASSASQIEVAHRFGAGAVAARGQAREHAAERDLLQQITPGEHLEGGQRDLGTGDRAHPWLVDANERSA